MVRGAALDTLALIPPNATGGLGWGGNAGGGVERDPQGSGIFHPRRWTRCSPYYFSANGIAILCILLNV